jgi:hypothetical protein
MLNVMPDPHWTQVLSALLTPVIAALAVFIAYDSKNAARDKLKLDLFERRLEIYTATRDVLALVLIRGSVTHEEIQAFLYGVCSARWLLNDQIADYMQTTLGGNLYKLLALEGDLKGLSVGADRTRNVEEQRELKTWLERQYDALDAMFTPFLRVKH